MGKGKGSVSYWIAKIKKGQILYEISGFSHEIAKQVLMSGSKKLPIKTKIIFK
jgi:large subunit ribosomal protein L16